MAEVALLSPIPKVFPGNHVLGLWKDDALPEDVQAEMATIAGQWQAKFPGAEVDRGTIDKGLVSVKVAAKDVAVVWVEPGRVQAGTYFIYAGEGFDDGGYLWERRQMSL